MTDKLKGLLTNTTCLDLSSDHELVPTVLMSMVNDGYIEYGVSTVCDLGTFPIESIKDSLDDNDGEFPEDQVSNAQAWISELISDGVEEITF